MFNMTPYRGGGLRTRADSRDFLSPFADDFFRAFFGDGRLTGSFKVDVEDKGDLYLMEADLPGFNRDDIQVSIEDGVMTISAQTNETKEEKKANYVCRERRYGSMSRSFHLDGVKEDGVSAEFKDGVLRLTLPKETEAPRDTARRIDIQ